jgi:hypothetical protein
MTDEQFVRVPRPGQYRETSGEYVGRVLTVRTHPKSTPDLFVLTWEVGPTGPGHTVITHGHLGDLLELGVLEPISQE